MRNVVQWDNKVHDRDGVKQTIYSVAFRPDGLQLIAAAGNRVLVYDCLEGDLVQSLRGHKDTVYCVAYAKDGKRFASGGADKCVIIWTRELEGILKYQHLETIQCLAYNPITQQLASCTTNDFGLWSPEQKTVNKHKVSSKILCSSWTNDGQYIALGLYSGIITLRDKKGNEAARIDRGAPVWAMAFSPAKDDVQGLLAVTDWNKKLSFYQTSGKQIGRDHELGFDALSLSFWTSGEYVCIGGSNKGVYLYTKDGVYVSHVTKRDDWVWSCAVRPINNGVGIGCNDGTVAMHQVVFNTVHGLYQDRYAYREAMTEVVIQNLATDEKTRLPCGDYIKRIAIYNERLAVQLPERILIHEVSENGLEVQETPMAQIDGNMDCNLLVVTSAHIILCQEKKLQLFTYEGRKEREWVLDGLIRYIKVVGGAKGRECLLVGVKSGEIMKVFVDNPFPVHLVNQNASIRCLDLSASRRKLAVVDEHGKCHVYDLVTKELLFTEPNANSVAWNTEHEELLCFSGNSMLNIKASSFPVHQQKLQGFVVGFKGSKIFCLHVFSMKTIDVPQGASLHQYREAKDFENAYKVACLGVTESDWRALAIDALHDLNLTIARKCFIRLRDLKYIEVCDAVGMLSKRAGVDDDLLLGEILAYEGKFQQAGRMFVQAGQVEKAMDLFADLGKWELAEEVAGRDDERVRKLVRRQIRSAKEGGYFLRAASLHVAIQELPEAIECIGESLTTEFSVENEEKLEVLIKICRDANRADVELIRRCAEIFQEHKAQDFAAEAFLKVGDHKALIMLYVSEQLWEKAFELLNKYPAFAAVVYVPYAEWLCENDDFEAAVQAYRKCSEHDKAQKVLEGLTHNAVVENRFDDAGLYFFLLSQEHALRIESETDAGMSRDDRNNLRRFRSFYTKAELYYAYHFVHRYIEMPFSEHEGSDKALFHIARFLLGRIAPPNSANRKKPPFGISRVYTTITLAREAWKAGAYRLARYALDDLQNLTVPAKFREEVDHLTLRTRAKNYVDDEDLKELYGMCARCGQSNELLVANGACVHCHHPFVYSFYSFRNLPLVEFVVEEGVSDDEAMRLIESGSGKSRDADKWKEGRSGAAETLTLDDSDNKGDNDPFDERQFVLDTSDTYVPITVGRAALKNLDLSEVVVRRFESPAVPTQWFRNFVPECPVIVCPNCQHFYSEDDYELASLKSKACVFCHTLFEDV